MTTNSALRKRITAALLAAGFGLLAACSNNDTPTEVSSQPNPGKFFNRVATFIVCEQVGSSCETDTETAAEIVAASTDGMTLIYTNAPKGEVGFVSIMDPASPKALGAVATGGDPTSVAVLGDYAVAAVDLSKGNFVAPSGKLMVINVASRTVVREITLAGQPDSVAVSKDGKYIAVVLENQRDEDFNKGALPQAPAGALVIVDSTGAPATWTQRTVALTGLASSFEPTDPEPEYVAINDDNIAVVTFQENNHIALVDLKAGTVKSHFSAGSVTLTKVDLIDETDLDKKKNGKGALVKFSETQANRLREPDGVTWISKTQFVTANEGDLVGGSRGFTVFNTDGTVAYDSGNSLEYLMARYGHYTDRRSDAKGNEPENVTFARFEGTDYLFVASERSSVVTVFDMSSATPTFKQVLPGALSPEGVLAIPSRNLFISASEVDDRGINARGALNIYQYQSAAKPAYPTLQSADRSDGTPIPWAAMSGLVAASTGKTLYAVDDSFFRSNRIFEIDVTTMPGVIKREIFIKDTNGVLAALASTLPATADKQAFDAADLAKMINADGTVNLDPEGISLASGGGFWIASEGAGSKTAYETEKDINSANLLVRVDSNGVIQRVIRLPADVDAKQARYGFEGVSEVNNTLVVAFQRAWTGETQPRIGIYDLNTNTWSFRFYPLDPPASPNGGWVGLSEITAIGGNRFLLVERDNMAGPDARIKRVTRIDLTGTVDGQTLTKTLVKDLMPVLGATKGQVIEKVEGLAVLSSGEVFILTDNDGVNDNSGETQLISLGTLN